MASHQVVITFDIDENKVIENATKEAARQLASKVMESVFGGPESKTSWYYPARVSVNMKEYVVQIVHDMLEEEKEAIISEAIKETTAGFRRTKAVQEKLKEAIEGD